MTNSATQEHRYRFEPSQVIDDRYRVIEPLGFGGFAEVYKCQDMQLERTFAVKVMNRMTSREDVLREAQTAAQFQHPNILRVINIGDIQELGNGYIVMDYQEGSRTLEEVLDDAQENLRRLPLDENTLRIVSQVADALHYAHSMDIVHQDVKPSNIIIDAQGNAYLTDFGLAMTKRLPGSSMKTVDAVSGMSGTIPYMSPEQFEEEATGRPLSPSTDIYSLGVVTYEMLVGQLPYPGKAAAPIIRQIVEGVRTPPRQLNAEIEEKVQTVLLKVLSKDPTERYASTTAFARALRQAAQAYITAEKLYHQAKTLIDQRQWRQALSSFEQLEEHAPSYKETRLFLERVRRQVQLLDLYNEAQALLERGEYEASLAKLQVLQEIDPQYVVTNVRDRALAGLTDRLYAQAKQQLADRAYRDCLETFQELRHHDRNFADRDGIAEQARRALERQQYLQTLYDASIQQVQSEDWVTAQQTLETLARQEAGYADVEARLTMVRHMARLSGIYHAAQRAYDDGDYGPCIDHIKELTQIDDTYKIHDIEALRKQAVEAMYEQAEHLLQDDQFEAAIETLDALDQRTQFGDPQGVRDSAQQGIVARQLHHELSERYAQAEQRLSAGQYRASLELMNQIRAKDPEYPDIRAIQERAQERLCGKLYNQALTALTEKRYQDAWDVWEQIVEIDPTYADPQDVRARAVRGLDRRKWLVPLRTLLAWLQRVPHILTDRRVVIGGAITAAVIVLLVIGWFAAAQVRARAAANTTATAVAQTARDQLTASAQEAIQTVQARETATTEASQTSSAEVASTATAQIAATATTEADLTASAAASAQETVTAATATAEATATAAAAATRTAQAATATAAHEATVAAQETAHAVATATAVAQTAVAERQASVLPAPVWIPGTQLGYLSSGDPVTVLGRAPEDNGRWLYVQTADEIEGYVFADYFAWPGEWDELDEIEPTVTVVLPSPTPRLRPPPGSLAIEYIWSSTDCTPGGWVAYFEVKVSGGDGRNYTFYWDEEQVDYTIKPGERDVAIIQRPGIPGRLVGTISVESGGQRTSGQTNARQPDC